MSAVKLIRAQKFAPTEMRGKAALSIAAVSEDQLTFEGVASKTELDRQDDIVVAGGLEFPESVPLLVAHDHRQPIGRAYLRRVGDTIRFRAQLARVTDGELGERIASAWLAIRAGLTDSVSIGFKPLEQEPLPSGGWKYTRAEILELSVVVVPALASARIDPTSVKHMPGDHRPAVRAPLPPGLTKQQISDLRHAEARRKLGKSAGKPATNELLSVCVMALRDHDRTLARGIQNLDERLRALEAGQARTIEVVPVSRSHPGAVKLLRVNHDRNS